MRCHRDRGCFQTNSVSAMSCNGNIRKIGNNKYTKYSEVYWGWAEPVHRFALCVSFQISVMSGTTNRSHYASCYIGCPNTGQSAPIHPISKLKIKRDSIPFYSGGGRQKTSFCSISNPLIYECAISSGARRDVVLAVQKDKKARPAAPRKNLAKCFLKYAS